LKNILFNDNGIVTDKAINKAAESSLSELVAYCEKRYDDQISRLAELLVSSKQYKIVLLAGPSGSGKTTTARKLSEKIIAGGKNALYVSLDDFFLNREDLPKLPSGETDFESVYTLDIEEIRKCFSLLLSGKKASIPYFDFTTGRRAPDKARDFTAGENDIIIVEGLHAINTELTDGIDAFDGNGFYKLFVNPDSQIYKEDGTKALKRRTLRMMRRMIRDYYFRGSSLENTLNMWEGVCREEIKTIIPFKDTADTVVDTTHFYEPCIYHNYLLPIIKKSQINNPKHAETLAELTACLDLFFDAPCDAVPANSMIREFIGEA
ncbi:MAG: zeta toxin family protein, partial [Oscillospiraceae bacterium]|nr:zeta toxin family protein [Oscillospiraceae bacterium]